MNKEVSLALIIGFIITVSLIVGAYLVVSGHPWFALLVVVIGASVRYTPATPPNKPNQAERTTNVINRKQ